MLLRRLDDPDPAVGGGDDPPTMRRWPRRRLQGLVTGPLPPLPGALDAVAEGWWRLPPRVRVLAIVLLVVGVVVGLAARASRSPWGPPVPVVVATADLEPGDPVQAAMATWPADLVDADAVATPPRGVATRPVTAGTVLTADDVAADLADLLEPDEVALALDQAVPGLPDGASLDLLGTDFDGRGRRLGPARLLAVDQEWTWIAVDRDTAPSVAAALSTGQVTVALAPSQ